MKDPDKENSKLDENVVAYKLLTILDNAKTNNAFHGNFTISRKGRNKISWTNNSDGQKFEIIIKNVK